MNEIYLNFCLLEFKNMAGEHTFWVLHRNYYNNSYILETNKKRNVIPFIASWMPNKLPLATCKAELESPDKVVSI